ncbi:RagB/SusD family nutrient uptake outer membrane protein [Chitinophaga filiformis]|uniref:RagB/SusD family nutrient uptake outer membrane protein n=1 Tax=Chitinophaga filiformis TaxID=104663 RepID=UPI001F387DB0|nr:RagB/SusD family nutrient uptake outer membrane protein [Chitinophaga filiformis]MCF6406834.1 RagB/SusD family nutrient uptake outer membrane protein [Chitinophaga filiformis]
MKISIIKLLALSLLFTGCKKYLDNGQLPAGTIGGSDAYISDNSISAIVTGSLAALNGAGPDAFPALTGLYADELAPMPNTSANNTIKMCYADAISPATVNYWSSTYSKIYALNLAIEGINATNARLYFKNQWLGECYFLRAFNYYYLTNLYGDVALALTSDFNVTNKLSRAPQRDVYQQIISDLKTATSLLSATYKNGYGAVTSDRARPNLRAAQALLAKMYLATGEWQQAADMADAVIADNSTYKLVQLADVFLKNSQETIWSMAKINDEKTTEFETYNNSMPATVTTDPVSTYLVQVQLTPDLLNSFEPGDARYTNWVRSTTYTGITPAATYYFPDKYKSIANGVERSMILRLADVYLVRAEARVAMKDLNGAKEDINVIRNRAGLPNTTASTETGLLAAIAQERRVELFTEMGNRFFDLRRTGKLDATMLAAKGSNVWAAYKQFWPIPPTEITYNPNLTQTFGY